MGILQAGYRTYEARRAFAGIETVGKEPLVPIAHAVLKAQIEITITDGGRFENAAAVSEGEEKTIVPVTVESAGRSSSKCAPHPLCDQLCYLAPFGGIKYDFYVRQLAGWAGSAYSHPKVRAVLAYIQKGNIVRDLARAGVIGAEADVPVKGGVGQTPYDKCMIRWRVIPPPEGVLAECWRDTTLFECFTGYYLEQNRQLPKALCYVSGREDAECTMHPKGVLRSSFSAKLVSANDESGFTYRGRFRTGRQAYILGYTASQMAHNGLRWAAANYGFAAGGRTFICWSPEGAPLPTGRVLFNFSPSVDAYDGYKDDLAQTFRGYRQGLRPDDRVVVAALDAATTGRLSVTYFNELKGSDFLERVEAWYAACCIAVPYGGVQSPPLTNIIHFAFGIARDDKAFGEHIQRLIGCISDRRAIPQDIVCALAQRASFLQTYSDEDRRKLMTAACAVIRKYRNEKNENRQNKEEWTVSLDKNQTDRSYLYGRLLAIAEKVERSTYDQEEKREPNAVRMLPVFARRPAYAWQIIYEQLTPYFAKLAPGLRAYYKNMIEEIADMLDAGDPALGKSLKDTYLLGYFHQQAAMSKKKEINDTEELDHE